MADKFVFETTGKERVSYGIYFFGQLTVYTVVGSFLQLYLTDIGISAAAVALIFLIGKIWDAVNDPLFGALVNRVNFKKGKYTPWLKSSAFIIPLCTIFLFAIPSGLSGGFKFALALIAYIGWDMSYTLCDVPVFSVVTVMTHNIRERTTIITYGRTIMFIGGLLASTLVPILYPAIGWFTTVAMLSLIALLTMVPLGYTAKERYRPPAQAENASIKELFRAVVQNRYLLLIVIGSVIALLTATGSTVVGYFAIHCLGAPQYMSVMHLMTLIPLLVITPFVPAIIKRMDKYTLLMISHGGAILTSILLFLVGYSGLPVFFTLYTIRSACMVLPPGILLPMFVLDCAEYGLYKTGKSTTALAVSLQTFTAKLPGAASGALAMFVLGLAGFVSGAGAVQPPGVISATWILLSIVPVAGMLAAFFMLFFGYKLRDRDIQIMARANQGELSREEADKLLSPGISR
jgi:sugar (glycoside-pentoside-hexuronide) transporter